MFRRLLTSLVAGAVSVALSAPAIAAATRNPPPEISAAGSFAQLLFGLALVVGVIFAFAWVTRRLGRLPSANAGAIKVIGGQSLGPRERVVLLQVGGTQLLVGIAPGRVQTLHVLDQPIAPASAPSAPASGGGFAERLAGVLRQQRPS